MHSGGRLDCTMHFPLSLYRKKLFSRNSLMTPLSRETTVFIFLCHRFCVVTLLNCRGTSPRNGCHAYIILLGNMMRLSMETNKVRFGKSVVFRSLLGRRRSERQQPMCSTGSPYFFIVIVLLIFPCIVICPP